MLDIKQNKKHETWHGSVSKDITADIFHFTQTVQSELASTGEYSGVRPLKFEAAYTGNIYIMMPGKCISPNIPNEYNNHIS